MKPRSCVPVRGLVAAAAVAVVASACVPPAPTDESGPVEFTADYLSLGYESWATSAMATAPFSDGGIAVVGRTDSPGGSFVISKLRADSSRDPSFKGGSDAIVPAPDDAEIADVVVDGAGRILVVAIVRDSDAPDPFLIRLLPTGELDPAFGDSGIVAPEEAGFMPVSVMALADGRYAVAGAAFPGPEDPPIAAVAVLLESGNIDESFGDDGLRGLVPDGIATAVAMASDGRLLVAGSIGVDAEDDLPSGGFLFAVPPTGGAGGSGGTTALSVATDIAVDSAGRVLLAGITSDYLGMVVRYPSALPTSGEALVADPSFGSGGSTAIDPGTYEASLVRSIDINTAGELIGTAWIADLEGADPNETLFRLDPDGELNTLLGDAGLVGTELSNPGMDLILNSRVSLVPDDVLWIPAPLRNGSGGAWVGRFTLPDPTPPPTCPTEPIRVTADNAAGVPIARWVCGMELVGTIWRGEGVLVLLPSGYFTCPTEPTTFWFDPGAEFGFYLLQAKCGYEPQFRNTWIGTLARLDANVLTLISKTS